MIVIVRSKERRIFNTTYEIDILKTSLRASCEEIDISKAIYDSRILYVHVYEKPDGFSEQQGRLLSNMSVYFR